MIYRASACGKMILLGEHAVVYGFPAVAIPVAGLRARAELAESGAAFTIDAPAVGLASALEDLPPDHPLAFCVRRTAEFLATAIPAARLTISSDIPVASGLGSGAAVSTAIVRVLSAAVGRSPTPAEISRIVFDVERIYHGTPSGIDNTVIAYERPVYFRREREPDLLRIGARMQWLLADSGVPSETRSAVGGVRQRWQADPARYEDLFRKIGALADLGRRALENGNEKSLGETMNRCHELLQAVGVSTPELDRLVDAAHRAGALGAKLTGAGLGGNIVVLADPQELEGVESALRGEGAAAVYRTTLEPGQ
jgi:mevalonate kinase